MSVPVAGHDASWHSEMSLHQIVCQKSCHLKGREKFDCEADKAATSWWRLLVPEHTTVHQIDLQEPRHQQVPTIVLPRGQDASRGCSPPPDCLVHPTSDSGASEATFFPRAFSAAVPAFRLLWCVSVLAFVIVDFSQYCTSRCSSIYWYEVTLFWIYAQLVRSAFCFCFISITKPKWYQKTVRIQKTCNYRSCIILEIMKNLIGFDQWDTNETHCLCLESFLLSWGVFFQGMTTTRQQSVI